MLNGFISTNFLPFNTDSQARRTSKGFLFKMFDEKPTAIPDDPLIKTVGTIGKKKCGCQRKRKSPKAKNTKVYRGQGR